MKITQTLVNSLIECDKTLHNWARLLGQIGYKLVTPKTDYSHANFAWNEITNRLEGRNFGKQNLYSVAYDVEKNIFVLLSNNKITSINTKKRDYKEVISNLAFVLTRNGFENINLEEGLAFRFPQRFNKKGIALPIEPNALQLWKTLRTGANKMLKNTLLALNQDSEIRIWATNFDTGIFCDYGNGLQQFAGYAPADYEVINEPYFYNSFYQHNQRLYPHNFSALKNGYWETNKWAGAVLPISYFENIDSFITASESFLVDSSNTFLRNGQK